MLGQISRDLWIWARPIRLHRHDITREQRRNRISVQNDGLVPLAGHAPVCGHINQDDLAIGDSTLDISLIKLSPSERIRGR